MEVTSMCLEVLKAPCEIKEEVEDGPGDMIVDVNEPPCAIETKVAQSQCLGLPEAPSQETVEANEVACEMKEEIRNLTCTVGVTVETQMTQCEMKEETHESTSAVERNVVVSMKQEAEDPWQEVSTLPSPEYFPSDLPSQPVKDGSPDFLYVASSASLSAFDIPLETQDPLLNEESKMSTLYPAKLELVDPLKIEPHTSTRSYTKRMIKPDHTSPNLEVEIDTSSTSPHAQVQPGYSLRQCYVDLGPRVAPRYHTVKRGIERETVKHSTKSVNPRPQINVPRSKTTSTCTVGIKSQQRNRVKPIKSKRSTSVVPPISLVEGIVLKDARIYIERLNADMIGTSDIVGTINHLSSFCTNKTKGTLSPCDLDSKGQLAPYDQVVHISEKLSESGEDLEPTTMMKKISLDSDDEDESSYYGQEFPLKVEPSIDGEAPNVSWRRKHMCDLCASSFKTRDILKQHILKEHIVPSQFECTDCGKCFLRPASLAIHTRMHRPTTGTYVCNICPMKSFTRIGGLKRHLRGHEGFKNLDCPICGKSFTTLQMVKVHVALHATKKSHLCNFCSKGFKNKFNLKYHMLLHTGDRNHECKVCGKKFYTSSALKSHLVVHSSERLFICDICSKTFKNRYCIKAHMIFHMEVFPYKCDICSKSFKRLQSFKSHKLLLHRATGLSGRPTWTCDICSKVFHTRDGMLAHVHLHLGTKPYKCRDCGKRFASQDNMNQHAKELHASTFKCGKCPSTFRNKVSLKSHQRTHSKDRPFTCAECDMRFKSKCGIKQHLAVHRPKAFHCKICNKSITRKATFNKHQQSHGIFKVKRSYQDKLV